MNFIELFLIEYVTLFLLSFLVLTISYGVISKRLDLKKSLIASLFSLLFMSLFSTLDYIFLLVIPLLVLVYRGAFSITWMRSLILTIVYLSFYAIFMNYIFLHIAR
ncbi:hypothetical protein SUSAZ_07810 [Sulfolobus acidocaldarius SUSAZ]|nr:hypothetical protein SUSAZ_07810 [Sulfolobus acidocaldarius SUSAZ]